MNVFLLFVPDFVPPISLCFFFFLIHFFVPDFVPEADALKRAGKKQTSKHPCPKHPEASGNQALVRQAEKRLESVIKACKSKQAP